jgi:hypothetical protein
LIFELKGGFVFNTFVCVIYIQMPNLSLPTLGVVVASNLLLPSTSWAQTISPSVINSTGASAVVSNGTIEWNVGESIGGNT